MDVLFLSLRGSMYRYYQYLSAHMDLNCTVADYRQGGFLALTAPAPSAQEVDEQVAFHYARKKAKYNYPRWIWRLLKAFYAFQYRLYYRRLYRLMDELRPGAIALWNGHRLPESAAKSVAEQLNIPVAHFENGLLPNTTTFDWQGVNALNSVPRHSSFYRNYLPPAGISDSDRHLQKRDFHKRKKNHAKADHFFADLPERFLFVPFQVKFDSQVLVNSRFIHSMDTLYEWVEQALALQPDKQLQVVIKEHPSDPFKYRHLYHRNPRIRFMNHDTQTLIDQADGIITLNSSVGMEAILRHRKVIVVGDACYNIDGLTRSAHDPQALAHEIQQLPHWQLDIELIEHFLAYMKYDYCVPVAWQNADIHHVQNIQQRFKAKLYNQPLSAKDTAQPSPTTK